MAMTMNEARNIAIDKAGKHAATTWDLAAHVLANDEFARQLCELKAAITRYERTRLSDRVLEALDVGN